MSRMLRAVTIDPEIRQTIGDSIVLNRQTHAIACCARHLCESYTDPSGACNHSSVHAWGGQTCHLLIAHVRLEMVRFSQLSKVHRQLIFILAGESLLYLSGYDLLSIVRESKMEKKHT